MIMAQEGTLNLIRGDDQNIGLTVKNYDGSAYDLSGVAVISTIRDPVYFSDILVLKSGTSHIDPTGGITEIEYSGGDTMGLSKTKYYFDVKLLTTGNKLTTLLYGDLNLFPTN